MKYLLAALAALTLVGCETFSAQDGTVTLTPEQITITMPIKPAATPTPAAGSTKTYQLEK